MQGQVGHGERLKGIDKEAWCGVEAIDEGFGAYDGIFEREAEIVFSDIGAGTAIGGR